MKKDYAELIGHVVDSPKFIETRNDKSYYEFYIESRRDSGIVDVVPCITTGDILCDLYTGENSIPEKIKVIGEYRSKNTRDETGKHLVQYLNVKKIILGEFTKDINNVSLCGTICKEPNYRLTALGREICDITIAVNTNNSSCYFPVIAWGKNARDCSDMKVGEKILLDGRIQSRKYQKKIENEIIEKTAYEVSVNYITPLKELEAMM